VAVITMCGRGPQETKYKKPSPGPDFFPTGIFRPVESLIQRSEALIVVAYQRFSADFRVQIGKDCAQFVL